MPLPRFSVFLQGKYHGEAAVEAEVEAEITVHHNNLRFYVLNTTID